MNKNGNETESIKKLIAEVEELRADYEELQEKRIGQIHEDIAQFIMKATGDIEKTERRIREMLKKSPEKAELTKKAIARMNISKYSRNCYMDVVNEFQNDDWKQLRK